MDREKALNRIKEILWFLNEKELISFIEDNEGSFSFEYIKYYLDFLETWDLNVLDSFLKTIKNEIEVSKTNTLKQKILKEEEKEQKDNNLENILNF